ncbi:NAD(P)-dependent oxidoreductase [Bdellovibrionota bacterium FG-2]
MTQKVLLTGGTGFIGRQAIPALQSLGFEVHLTVLEGDRTSDLGKDLVFHSCNLLNFEQQRKVMAEVRPSHLLHFAWDVTPGAYWSSPENLRWVQASIELLRGFSEFAQGTRRTVFAGTCAEYDWSSGHCSEENTPMLPQTLYGVSKDSLRRIFDSFCRGKNISTAWGRIFFLYGPHEHPGRLVPSVIRSLLRDEKVVCKQPTHLRDFLHVTDVASGFVSLLKSDFQGSMNIASGHSKSLGSVVSQIARMFGKEDLITLSPQAANDSNRPSSLQDPPEISAEVSRLGSLGWAPRYSLESGLEQTINWWKAQPL